MEDVMGMGGRAVPIPGVVSAGCDLAGLNPHDVATVAMGAAAWAANMPIQRGENLEIFRATVNRVLAVFGLSFDFEEFEPNNERQR